MPCWFKRKSVVTLGLAGITVFLLVSRLLAQTAVYYSVGTSTADLKTAGNINITSGTATFSANQVANIGVGDEIVAGGNTYYISGRTSASSYSVITRTGATPANLATTTLTSIKRAFNTLSTAETNSSDSSHLGTASLTAANVVLNLAAYNDGIFNGADGSGAGLFISGYTTDSTRYIRLFAPASTGEVGISQRHTGKEGTGVRIKPSTSPASGSYAPIYFTNTNVVIEGLEIDGSSISNVPDDLYGIYWLNTSQNAQFDYLLIHDLNDSTTNGDGPKSIYGIVGANTSSGNFIIRNTVIYDLHHISTNASDGIEGMWLSVSSGTGYVYNNTIHNLVNDGNAVTTIGLGHHNAGTIYARNNYVGKVKNNAGGSTTAFSGSFTQSYNISSDATASGTGSKTGKNHYEDYFHQAGQTDTDLHLKATGLSLWGTNGTDLSGDANAPVTNDIDNQSRPATPDIGADQFNAAGPGVFYSVGTSTADLMSSSPNITITEGVAAFSTSQATNVGVGDEVSAAGTKYYINGRISATQYGVTTRTGAKPADLSSTAVTSIKRSFNTLGTAESNSTDSSHLGTVNLTSAGANTVLNWAVYKDGDFNGADGSGSGLVINGYTTDSTHYLRLFAPSATTEVGVSQRHSGKAGTGAVIRPQVSSGDYTAIVVDDKDVKLDGLEIDGTSLSNIGNLYGIVSAGTYNVDLDNMLVHDLKNSTIYDGLFDAEVAGLYMLGGGFMKVRNTMIYDVSNISATTSSSALGMTLLTGTGELYVNNCLVYSISLVSTSGFSHGILEGGGKVTVINTYVGKVTSKSPTAVAFYNVTDQSYNVSSDSTASGTGSKTGKTDYAQYFYDSGTTTTDLHLRHTSLSLWGTDGTDLDTDATLPVTKDIDGEDRSLTAPDIGADELTNEVASPPQTPHCEGATTPVANVTDSTPEFSAICDDPETNNCTYYEIDVNTQSNFGGTSMWATGKTSMGTLTENTRSSDVSYAGSALSNSTSYYWRIRFWDTAHDGTSGTTSAAGDWSATQTFTTGTLSGGNVAPNAPESPYCEGSGTDPVSNVTDTTPEFSAIYDDDNTLDTAVYYEIEVDTQSNFGGTRMWDTGKNGSITVELFENNRSEDFAYAGTTLSLNGSSYYWRIRFWDDSDAQGAWSGVSEFVMYNDAAPSAPQTPLCEGQTNPANVNDPTPDFSAIYDDDNTNDTALYYEVEVDTQSNFGGTRMWDTGKTMTMPINEGVRKQFSDYNGSALSAGSSYYWRTRFWDNYDVQGAWSATQNFTMSSGLPSGAGNVVYYSVGTSTADLKTAANVTLSDGLGTFSATQAANVGVGDQVVVGGNTYFISGRVSATQYLLTDRSGASPSNQGSAAVTSITRAFNSLSTVVSNSSDASHLGTNNLTSSGANVQLNWAAYKDGDFVDVMDLTGYTTDATHYIRLFAPVYSAEVGISQQHSGREGTGVRIKVNSSNQGALAVIGLYDDYIRIKGIEIDGSSLSNIGHLRGIAAYVSISNSNDIQIDSCIIHDFTNSTTNDGSAGGDIIAISIPKGNLKVSNNLIYDLTNVSTNASAAFAGIRTFSVAQSLYAYNNTIYNLTAQSIVPAYGIRQEVGTVAASNNFIGGVSSGASESAYSGTITQSYNISSDSTASGTGSKTGKTDYENYFIEASGTNKDLHLRNPSAIMWGTNGTDLSSDGTLPVTTDIDGEARPTSYRPDIGADEYTGGKLVYYSVGTNSANLSAGGNVTLSDGEATFTTAQASNIGVGDKLVAGGNTYYISGRNSATFYAVRTSKGGKPGDLATTSVTAITRAFNTLSSAESNSTDSSHLGTATLTSAGANVQLHWPAYKDGDFDENLTIDGYTTDNTHYLRLFAPSSLVEVGVSQRHAGKEGTGVVIKPTTTISAQYSVVTVSDDNFRLEGLEINGSNIISSTPEVRGVTVNNDILLDGNLINHFHTNSTGNVSGVSISGGNAKLINNIIYDLVSQTSGTVYGMYCNNIGPCCDPSTHVKFSTIYSLTSGSGNVYGIHVGAGNTAVSNTFVGNLLGGSMTGFSSVSTQSYNVSSDSTASGTGSKTGKSDYSVYFVESGSTNTDLHLKNNSALLWGTKGTDLSADTALPVSRDIDGETRAASPDIGADEFAGGAAVYYSVGTSTADLKTAANVSITDSKATFSASQATNVGVGDELVAGGNTYFITGRGSATQYYVSTRTGAKPANLASTSVTSITRVFNTLANSVWNSGDTGYLNSFDLTASGVNAQLNLALYNDGVFNGSDGSGGYWVVAGYTTDATHYLRFFSPSSSSEVGTSQRHTGKENSGVRIKPNIPNVSNYFKIVEIQDNYVRLEGVEIDGSQIANGGEIHGVHLTGMSSTASEIVLDQMLIHDINNSTAYDPGAAPVFGISQSDGIAKIRNTIIYDLVNNSTDSANGSSVYGIEAFDSATAQYINNSTVYGIINNGSNTNIEGIGFWSGVSYIKNTYVGNIVQNQGGSAYGITGYAAANQSYNVTFDSTASGTGSKTGKTDYTSYFYESGATTTDLHLRHTGLSLWGGNGTDLRTDANSPVKYDIDGDYRDNTTPDIGADEVMNEVASAPTTPYCEGQTNPSNITNATPAFSAIYDDVDTVDQATYYEIQVDTASNFGGTRKWNSNQTAMSALNENTRSADVTYPGAGSALASSTTYYWRIRFWDSAHDGTSSKPNVPGDWSATQNFSTGTLGGGNVAPNAPTTPWVEGQTNPTNVNDPTPDMSAIYSDPDTSDTARYYEINVNTLSNFGGTSMWGSGKTAVPGGWSGAENTRMPAVPYAGSALSASTTYYWQIRFWDAADAQGAWSATQNFTMASGLPSGTGNVVYYSVGTSTADLKIAANVTITDGMAAFDASQANNIGVGDQVVAGGNTYYITGRVTATQYQVSTRTGATPANLASTSLTSITRAFNSLSTAETNSTNSSHLGTVNLTSTGANVVLNWAAYNDGAFNGADGSGSGLVINGYTTDSTHYLRLYAPSVTSEVGISQRHSGKEGTGAVISSQASSGDYTAIDIQDADVKVDGLEIDGSSLSNIGNIYGLFSNGSYNVDFDNMLVHDLKNSTTLDGTSNASVVGLWVLGGGVYKVRNTMIYDLSNVSTTTSYRTIGMSLAASGELDVNNCFIYSLSMTSSSGSSYGVQQASGSGVTVKNSYVGKISSNSATHVAFSSVSNQSFNVSSDSTASGTGSKTGKTDYENYFIEAGSSNTDLHLRNPSAVLWGTNGTDLSSDGTLPVTTDIDGDARPTSYRPDIGPDEYTGGKLVYYSVGTSTADLSAGGNVTLSDGEATFTTSQAANVGVGDKLVAGGNTYFISGRASATFYAVRTRTGAKPADLSSSAVTSISRAFNTLGTAESNSTDSSHLGTATLTTAGETFSFIGQHTMTGFLTAPTAAERDFRLADI